MKEKDDNLQASLFSLKFVVITRFFKHKQVFPVIIRSECE